MAGNDQRTRIQALLDAGRSNFESIQKEIDAAFGGAVPNTPEPSNGILKVKVGDDVQKAFDTLLPTGGTLLLAPGVHKVNLKINERQKTDKLIIFTSDSTNLPKPGQRTNPSFAPALAILQNTDPTGQVVKGYNKSRNVAFINVGFGPPVTPSYTQVALGGDRKETLSVDQLPSNFLFDRVYCYGDPVKGAHRGIQMHANGVQVVGSYFKDIFEIGRDAQAVHSWNGGRNILLENDFFEASGENVMFGGADSASPDMITQDVIVRGCTMSKNFEWMKFAQQPSIKCLFETKAIKRLLVDSCLLENNWARDWPTGVALMLKAANGDGTETWATSEDVTIQNMIIRNVGSVFGFVGYGDSGKPTDRCRRIVIRNVLAYKINEGNYKGTGRVMTHSNPPDGFTLDHFTCVKNSHSWCYAWADQGQPPGEKLTFTNNIVANSEYAYISADNGAGMPAILKDWKAADINGNAFQAGSRGVSGMPTTNKIVSVADFDASLDSRFRVKTGSPIASVITTDGKKPGADVDMLVDKIGDVFA